LCFAELICFAEENKADGKKNDQCAHSNSLVFDMEGSNIPAESVCGLADYGNYSGTYKGSTFSADVHKAVVFATLFSGDNFAEVGTAQSLNAALEHTNQHCQHPELPLGQQEDGKDGNAGVGKNADLDQFAGIVLGRESAENNGEGERNDLGHKQGQKQAGGVQPQGFSVSGRHINDGIHAVNKEEERQQIEEDMLLFFRFQKGFSELPESSGNGIAFRFLEGLLLIGSGKGHTAADPPQGRDHKGDDQRSDLGDSDQIITQHQCKAENKRNYRTDVAIGIAHGGDLVHPTGCGDFSEHGIVEHQAGGIANLGNDEDHQEG